MLGVFLGFIEVLLVEELSLIGKEHGKNVQNGYFSIIFFHYPDHVVHYLGTGYGIYRPDFAVFIVMDSDYFIYHEPHSDFFPEMEDDDFLVFIKIKQRDIQEPLDLYQRYNMVPQADNPFYEFLITS
jgi:hypothetical protein